MQSVADIFALWPSDADVARDIGISYPTVSAWKQRGSIPVAYWKPFIQAARKRGYSEVTAALLVDVHARDAKDNAAGFAEDDARYPAQGELETERRRERNEQPATGHFSRHKHVRRNNFNSADEIEEHIRALREEWSHR